MMSEPSELERIHLFAHLDFSTRQKLAVVVRPAVYDDGQLITLEGDVDAPVFFVLEGTVRTFRTNPDGREQTLIHLNPGEAFNIPAAFADSQTAPASAMAVGPVRLIVISSSDFCRVAGETPQIALAVLRDLSNKLYHFVSLTHDLSLRSVRGRLARFLLTQVQTENTAPIHWTQEKIAAQIGTVREVVSRTMRSFVKEGLIEMSRQRITVLNPDALENETES